MLYTGKIAYRPADSFLVDSGEIRYCRRGKSIFQIVIADNTQLIGSAYIYYITLFIFNDNPSVKDKRAQIQLFTPAEWNHPGPAAR